MKKFFSSLGAWLEAGLPIALCGVGAVQAALGDIHAGLLFCAFAYLLALHLQMKSAAHDTEITNIFLAAIATKLGAVRKVGANDE
jgi:hypothetical protein